VLKLLILIIFPLNLLIANDYILQRQDSMQKFNKLMRSANQMTEYPTLFPDDSFKGKTKASEDIIANRDKFNEISLETAEIARLASLASLNNDIELLQQSHQNLFSTCKSCHSRFKN
jgi:cytochrome c556